MHSQPNISTQKPRSQRLLIITVLALLALAAIFFFLWRRQITSATMRATLPPSTVTTPNVSQSTPAASAKQADSGQVRKPTDTEEPKKPVQTVEADFFTIGLIECKKSGTTVACDLLITNRDNTERDFEIYSNYTYMHDNFGNQYHVDQTQIGNKEARIILVTEVPTKAKVVFNKVSEGASKITLLDLKFIVWDTPNRPKAQFRNIPLITDNSTK